MTVATINIWAQISICVAAIAICFGFIFTQFRINYNLGNLRRDIGNMFARILLGKRFIAKIDGIWRPVRGWVEHNDLSAVFPPDYKVHQVLCGSWKKVQLDWDEEEIENKIARLNITELKDKHPAPNDNYIRRNRRNVDPIEEYLNQIEILSARYHIDLSDQYQLWRK